MIRDIIEASAADPAPDAARPAMQSGAN
jgi:hypothetical protein